jgi:hypothetical protein
VHYSHPLKHNVVCASFIVVFAALQSSPKSVPTREFTTAQISDEVQEYVSWKSGVVVDSDLHHTFSDTIETNRFADLIYVGKKNYSAIARKVCSRPLCLCNLPTHSRQTSHIHLPWDVI